VHDRNPQLVYFQGYPFVYEAQALKSAKLAGAYSDIFNKIVGTDGLTSSVVLKGVIQKADAKFTRGSDSNFYPLTKY